MKIGIIGTGAIGQYVAARLTERGFGPHAILVRPARLKDGTESGPFRVASAASLPGDITHMIDCAGHGGLAEHGPAILKRGVDVITVSLGALADPALQERLENAARAGQAKLHLASGSIGALDCLRAARVGGLDAVTYTGRKPPQGWKGSPAETRLDLDQLETAAIHFEGTARQAATQYPKNANVAAAIALAGAGFDETRVQLIADPAVSANIHEVSATGAFGSLTFRVEGRPLPDNPRSSALAAMSTVAAIERLHAAITL